MLKTKNKINIKKLAYGKVYDTKNVHCISWVHETHVTDVIPINYI